MDVVDLGEFYASRFGNTTKRLIANRLRPLVGPVGGSRIVGLGYALPYLPAETGEARGCLALMPARQGVIPWPPEGSIRSCLVDECDLPLLESAVDLALVIHGLELTDAPGEMLKELWRVMSPQGRMLLVVPNRRGLWASVDTSPFGFGQPFSGSQLAGLLREAQFSIVSWSQALFMPPLGRNFMLSTASVWEAVGARITPGLGGVIVVEAVKQVYAISSGKRVRRMAPGLRPVLRPAALRQLVGGGDENIAIRACPPMNSRFRQE